MSWEEVELMEKEVNELIDKWKKRGIDLHDIMQRFEQAITELVREKHKKKQYIK